jgi:hypothetical protein
MKHLLPLCLMLWFVLPADADDAVAPHVKVHYEGIDQAQADSIAQTLSAARQVYVDDFGFDMPETIQCRATCGPDQTTRLYNDGNDSVFLSLKSKDQLAPPNKTGVYNLYGMCHELGHMAMYRVLKDRDWLTGSASEGWAHFAGSVVVDRVYEMKGEKLWYEPYDYRADGTARLNKSLKAFFIDDTTKAAGAWQKLDGIVGHKELPKIFKAWQDAKINLAKPSVDLIAVLKSTEPERASELDAWWKSAAPSITQDTKSSDFKKQTIAPAKLSGKPVKVVEDDDSAENKRSIAGSGHARMFTAPSEESYVVAVSIFGARYGMPKAPSTTFQIALCDDKMNPIATWSKPYSAFERGEMKWVRFDVQPTRLPKQFSICISFNPTATNGVYVGLDQSTHGHSQTALPGKPADSIKEGDWMIRLEVDQPKSADALGAK